MSKTSQQSIWIIDALRTAIARPGQSLNNFSAAQLSAVVIRDILSRSRISFKLVEQCIVGNAVSAGTGQNIARQAAVIAGLPDTVPSFSVNHVCGSAMQAVILASQSILAGDHNCVIAGGTESASFSPYLEFNNRMTTQGSSVIDAGVLGRVESLIHDGLFCQLTRMHMGQLAEYLSRKFDISRSVQDKFALDSHRKACAAQQAGKFRDEIVPVNILPYQAFDRDERPRRNIDVLKLGDLPAAFQKNGTVTAGNSSPPSDGACNLIIASNDFVKKYRITPKAKILGYSSIAVPPQEVFTAGVTAVKVCLKKCGLRFKDIDLFEIGEAFATQVIYTRDHLKIPDNQMNVWGGDIALGHPLGAAGGRILVTLIHALRDAKKNIGLACVCLGGGGALAIVVEI